MSYQLLLDDVKFYQRFLKSNGLYSGKLDGVWGGKTSAADTAYLDQSERIKIELGSFDKRSEGNILTLVPKAQVAVRKFLSILVNENGKDVRIISGTRTYAEQDALYRKGRFGSKLPKVTNAKGGQSNHNFGLAWDIGLFENGKYITAVNKYKQLALLVLSILPELEWGGNWITFPDTPHYQLKPVSDSMATIRELFENGSVYV